jgi:hypothetical protein
VFETGEEFRGGGIIQGKPCAYATAESEEFVSAEEVGEPGVAGEDDGEDGAGVELCGSEDAEFGEDVWIHFLGLVDDKDRAKEGGIDVSVPSFTEGLEADPAVVRVQGHAEEVAEFAVEIGEFGLRACERLDGEVGMLGEFMGDDAQGGTFAGARFSGEECETAFLDEVVFDAPEEVVNGRGGQECIDGDVGAEGIELEAVESEQFFDHWGFSFSLILGM